MTLIELVQIGILWQHMLLNGFKISWKFLILAQIQPAPKVLGHIVPSKFTFQSIPADCCKIPTFSPHFDAGGQGKRERRRRGSNIVDNRGGSGGGSGGSSGGSSDIGSNRGNNKGGRGGSNRGSRGRRKQGGGNQTILQLRRKWRKGGLCLGCFGKRTQEFGCHSKVGENHESHLPIGFCCLQFLVQDLILFFKFQDSVFQGKQALAFKSWCWWKLLLLSNNIKKWQRIHGDGRVIGRRDLTVKKKSLQKKLKSKMPSFPFFSFPPFCSLFVPFWIFIPFLTVATEGNRPLFNRCNSRCKQLEKEKQ